MNTTKLKLTVSKIALYVAYATIPIAPLYFLIPGLRSLAIWIGTALFVVILVLLVAIVVLDTKAV